MAAKPEPITADKDLQPLSDLTDRELLLRITRQLDHLDTQMHDIHRITEKIDPHIDKGLALLDPAAAWRRAFGRKPKNGAAQAAAAAEASPGDCSGC